MKIRQFYIFAISMVIAGFAFLLLQFAERRIREHNFIQCTKDGFGTGMCAYLMEQVNK